MTEQVAVLGAGFAGLRTALELANRGYNVTLIDLRERHEYIPGIIDILRDRVSSERLALDLEELLEDTGVEFRQTVIEGVLPAEKKVVTGEGESSYDSLVVALGAEPATFGIDISEAHGMYSLESAEAVEQELEDAETALIVGSGYVGIETAGELEAAGLEVKVVDRATRPMPNSPEKASHQVLDYIQDREISFMGGRTVAEVQETGVKTEDGEEIEADIVIWSGGIQTPEVVRNSFDAEASGIAVNSGLSSEKYSGIFAAGDCADTAALDTAHNAIEQAKLVAENLGKGNQEALEQYEPGTTPLVVSVGRTGIFIYGTVVLRNRLFRYLKDAIRWVYMLGLKFAGLKARYL